MTFSNTDKKPLISVVTPVLNGEQYIEENLQSVKSQGYHSLEHIVMDGGSNDRTIDILKKYEKTYNLKWFSRKDNGAVNAMNKGFERASGDILCSLDSDDLYLRGTINKVLDIFQKYPEVDVVFGDTFFIDKDGKKIGYSRRTNFSFDMFLYLGMNIFPQAAFWRRKIYEKVSGMDEQYMICSDRDFFMKMFLKGAKFYHLREFLCCYRLHKYQQTSNKAVMDYESQRIFETYVPKNLSTQDIKYKKSVALIKKALWLAKQGDSWYVLKGVLERLGFLRKVSIR